jgi:hypothetical protein
VTLFPFTFFTKMVASWRSPDAQRQFGLPQRTFTLASEPPMNGPTDASSRNFAARRVRKVLMDSCFMMPPYGVDLQATPELAIIINIHIYKKLTRKQTVRKKISSKNYFEPKIQ